ncbi:MAG TPA: hypothetical protein VGN69_06995 [Solirubrobacteraceae bacterium]|nr:hypothetical protein [Solirubrobacteraceae bacterium]
MSAEQRRAIIFFACSVAISMALTAIDLSGYHSLILRVAAVFSLVTGIAVLLLRGRAR